jgi:hypothetical protein
MSKPTIIFLRNGLISVMAALTVWLLPFMLREGKRPPQGQKEIGSDDGQDLLKELDVAFVAPKLLKQQAQPEPQPQILSQHRLLPQQTEPAAQPQARSQPAKPQPQPTDPVPLPQAQTRPQPAPEPQSQPTYYPEPKAVLSIPRLDPVAPAPSIEANQESTSSRETFADRLRKASLNEAQAAKPLPSAPLPQPQPAYAAAVPRTEPAVAPRSEPAVFKPEVAVALPPPLPQRHPLRMASLADLPDNEPLPTIQAAVIQEKPRPRPASNTFVGFLSTLLRKDEAAARPAAPQSRPDPQVVAVATAPGSPQQAPRPDQPPAASSKPRNTTPKWTPSACSTANDFWKKNPSW